jgi:hypothetical protein
MAEPGIPESTDIGTGWIVIFLLLVLGVAAGAILFIGGDLVAGSTLLHPSAF